MPNADLIFDAYESINPEHRDEDTYLIRALIESGLDVHTIRYGIIKDVYRGAAQTVEGDLFYFHLAPEEDIIVKKADDKTKVWEANRLLKSCHLGADLVKSEVTVKEDKEETDKAQPSMAVSAPVSEEENIEAQERLATEAHPGSAVGTTPDTNSNRWHKSINYADVLKSFANELRETAPVYTPSPQEQQFMVEVLGRNPQEVAQGKHQLAPTQRVLFNQWLGKSTSATMAGIEAWIRKHGG